MSNFFNSKELLIDGISKLQFSKIPNPHVDVRILLNFNLLMPYANNSFELKKSTIFF